MARGRGLYPRIVEPDNLRLAFKKAARGKGDRQEVIIYRRDLDENLSRLRIELLTGDIAAGGYRFFQIYDPKERTICAAPFRDRVLHHAVMNLCEPILERYSIHDSYACRTGKGLHAALIRAREFAGRFEWFLKLDIRKYFDSIPHETLLALLARRFLDKRLMELFRRIVATHETEPGRGLPIGNLLSQHFANFYLGAMDHWLLEKRRIPGYVRYMDDFLLFGATREQMKTEFEEIEAFLSERLQLSLKNNRQLNRCERGIPFLGFRVFPHVIRLGSRSRKRFAEKLYFYEQEAEWGALGELDLSRRVSALVSFTQAADAAGFRRSVINGRGCRPQGLEPRETRRQLEQQPEERPGGEPQQQRPRQP